MCERARLCAICSVTTGKTRPLHFQTCLCAFHTLRVLICLRCEANRFFTLCYTSFSCLPSAIGWLLSLCKSSERSDSHVSMTQAAAIICGKLPPRYSLPCNVIVIVNYELRHIRPLSCRRSDRCEDKFIKTCANNRLYKRVPPSY